MAILQLEVAAELLLGILQCDDASRTGGESEGLNDGSRREKTDAAGDEVLALVTASAAEVNTPLPSP